MSKTLLLNIMVVLRSSAKYGFVCALRFDQSTNSTAAIAITTRGTITPAAMAPALELELPERTGDPCERTLGPRRP